MNWADNHTGTKRRFVKQRRTLQKGKSDKGILDIIILFAVGNRSSNRLLSMFPGVKPKVCASNGEESMDNILMITFYLEREIFFFWKRRNGPGLCIRKMCSERKILMIFFWGKSWWYLSCVDILMGLVSCNFQKRVCRNWISLSRYSLWTPQ